MKRQRATSPTAYQDRQSSIHKVHNQTLFFHSCDGKSALTFFRDHGKVITLWRPADVEPNNKRPLASHLVKMIFALSIQAAVLARPLKVWIAQKVSYRANRKLRALL